MDQLLVELIGKPTLNSPKVITVVADNFSLLEDQARFLKATIAIPDVKELPLETIQKRLIQIGPIQNDIADQIRRCKWALNQYEDLEESICDRIGEDLQDVTKKSIVYINDITRLCLYGDHKENVSSKLLSLVENLRKKHFVVLIYQNSFPPTTKSQILRNLEYISDSVVRIKSCKEVYFKSIWWQTIPTRNRTLIPSKIETRYYTCKIGKNYWSTDLLCFYEKKEVAKNYNPDDDLNTSATPTKQMQEDQSMKDSMSSVKLDDDDSDEENYGSRKKDSSLPYTLARNPEQSRIFYYPDKDDDIDEDDPDNDLNF